MVILAKVCALLTPLRILKEKSRNNSISRMLGKRQEANFVNLSNLGTSYIKEFTDLILDIFDMSNKDLLFFSIDSLQSWVKTELKRHGVQDLTTTITTIESFIDFSTLRDATKPKEKKPYQGKGEGEHNKSKREGNKDDDA